MRVAEKLSIASLVCFALGMAATFAWGAASRGQDGHAPNMLFLVASSGLILLAGVIGVVSIRRSWLGLASGIIAIVSAWWLISMFFGLRAL